MRFAFIRIDSRMHHFRSWTMTVSRYSIASTKNVIVSANQFRLAESVRGERDSINEIFRFIFDGINHFLFKSFSISISVEVKCILLTSISYDTIVEHLKLVVCCVCILHSSFSVSLAWNWKRWRETKKVTRRGHPVSRRKNKIKWKRCTRDRIDVKRNGTMAIFYLLHFKSGWKFLIYSYKSQTFNCSIA